MSILKDFRDGNKALITAFKGTDKTYIFNYVEESGSAFIFENYDVTCEGRLASANEIPDFTFPITKVFVDDENRLMVLFPATIITSFIRENRVYWKVIARHKTSGLSKVINYGELMLKEF